MSMKCRICDTEIKEPFLSLGNSPISNAYLTKSQTNQMEPYYPLDVYLCPQCYLVQIDDYESAGNIFTADYAYFSSYSTSWLDHCKAYADQMVQRLKLDERSLVLEVGSNDGYLLQYFKEKNIPVLGVEPTANTAKVAIAKGVPTDIEFFNTLYAEKLRNSGKTVDLLIGNNVLAHNPFLNDFVHGIGIAIESDGIATLEFPHLLPMIRNNEFDTIYQEHYSYFSLYPVVQLFQKHNMEIFDVDEIPTHGGSLRIYAKHINNKTQTVEKSVRALLDREKAAGLFDLNTYNEFARNIRSIKMDLLQFLIESKMQNKQVVGYGAPAKGNTLLNYCGIRTDFLDYTVDRNPQKQGKYLPGTHIPVYPIEKIKETKPDYVLILPWNIKDEVVSQMNFIRDWGAMFITAIPELKVF